MQLATIQALSFYAIALLLATTSLVACVGFYDSDNGGDERFLAASRDGDDLVIHLSDCATTTINRARIYSNAEGGHWGSDDLIAEVAIQHDGAEFHRETLNWADLGKEFAVDVSGPEYRALLLVDPAAVPALPAVIRFDEEMVQFGDFGTTCD